MSNDRLRQELTVSQAVGLAVTIVIGSGLLLLPGLSYARAGSSSLYVWVACAVLVAPLLVIFSVLGAKYPTAGGVAGFLQNAFSRDIGAATEVLLLGTFGLGIPAIALTGSYYLLSIFTTSPSDLSILAVSIGAVGVGFVVNYFGVSTSGNVQKYLAIALTSAIFVIAIVSIVMAGNHSAFDGEGLSPLRSIDTEAISSLVGTIFFAFTGWEMLSFTIEEYRNPKRDYPVAVALSFVVVVGLYCLLALAIQLIVPLNDPSLRTAPLSALVGHAIGNAYTPALSLLSFMIIMANLIGAVWAASRLVFSSSREGLLPKSISTLDGRKTPRMSILVTCTMFWLVLTANYLGIFDVADLLRFAGQNFLLLYGMAVLAYLKISVSWRARAFGALTLVIVVLTMGTFGLELIYPMTLLLLGFCASRMRSRQKLSTAVPSATDALNEG